MIMVNSNYRVIWILKNAWHSVLGPISFFEITLILFQAAVDVTNFWVALKFVSLGEVYGCGIQFRSRYVKSWRPTHLKSACCDMQTKVLALYAKEWAQSFTHGSILSRQHWVTESTQSYQGFLQPNVIAINKQDSLNFILMLRLCIYCYRSWEYQMTFWVAMNFASLRFCSVNFWNWSRRWFRMRGGCARMKLWLMNMDLCSFFKFIIVPLATHSPPSSPIHHFSNELGARWCYCTLY